MAERSYPTSKVRAAAERSYHSPRSGEAAERSNPTSKEQWLHGGRRA